MRDECKQRRPAGKVILSQAGVGVIEAMVAAGLLGVTAIGVIKVSETMNKGNAKARTNSEVLLATNEITSFLADPENCRATIPAVTDSISRVKFKGADRFQTGELLMGTTTKVSGYQLIYPAGSPTSADLIVSFDKRAVNGPGTKTRKVNLYVEVNPDKTVKHCRAVAADNDFWTRGSGDWADDIFFTGRVGIGSETPRYQLEVKNEMATVSLGGKYAVEHALTFDDTGKPQADGGHPVFFGLRSRGTIETPAFSKKGDILASFLGRDFKSHSDAQGKPAPVSGEPVGGASIYMIATEDTTSSAKGAQMIFQTTKNGTDTSLWRMVINHNGNVNILNPEQSRVHLVGGGDTGSMSAFSGLYLGGPHEDQKENSWFMLHRMSGAFHIGKWTGGSSTSVISMTKGKSVGINTLTPSETLHVGGNILSSGIVASSSDERLKTEIKGIFDPLPRLLKIRGVNFEWKVPPSGAEGTQLGVLAQEVEQAFPEAVRTGINGLKSVAYGALIAPIVEAVKQLANRSDKVEERLRLAEEENRYLRRLVCATTPDAPTCLDRE